MFTLPKVELIEQGPGKEGMLKHIELAGRTAYKSEDKITEDSAKKFVDMLLARGHLSPLEHGTVYYKVPDRYDGSGLRDIIKWMHGNLYSWFSPIPLDESSWYFVTNYRVLIENPWIADKLERYGTQCDWEPLFMQRMTLRITCNRGVSHELVRHRKFSFTQESTRFCNYTKDKFDKDITWILPCWIDKKWIDLTNLERASGDVATFLGSLGDAKRAYFNLIAQGWRPEQAREVLPNALKTEIVMTGFLDDWVDFVRKRSEHVHPEMKVIVDQIREYVNIQRSKYYAKEREEYKKTWDAFEEAMKNCTPTLEKIEVIKDDIREGLSENDGGTGQNNS